MNDKKIGTRELVISDENDQNRFVVSSKLPDPRIDGKTYKRDVQVSGIQMLDNKGEEIGGIGIIDQQRAVVLGFDYKNHEAIVAYAYDNENGHGSGISVNSKDVNAKVDEPKHYSQIQIKAEDGVTQISFVGRDGKEKMLLGLDDQDRPFIKIASGDNSFVDVTDKLLQKS